MSEVPTNDNLLALLLRDAQVPFDKIKQYESGSLIDMPEQKIAPARPDRAQNKFELLPEDVGQELRDFTANTALPTEQFPLQLSVRPSRHVMNTTYRHLAHVRKSMPENPLWINPEDITELGFSSGERVTLQSAYGSIHVQLKADASMRKGVVAIAHGWGGRAGLKDDAEQEVGVSVNDLIPGNERYEKINAMPWFSALPVRVLVSNNDRSG